MICSIDGCDRQVSRANKGWCERHYKRWWRHGDPTAGSIHSGEAQRYFRDVVLRCQSGECLTWPYGRYANGRAQLGINHIPRQVHRLACEHRHGPPPTPLHEAAHSCGNGHLGCVNPHHVSWKTHKENEADKLAHGTSPRGTRQGLCKLTEANVLTIVAERGKTSQAKLALRFNVSRGAIQDIHTGKNWNWLTGL